MTPSVQRFDADQSTMEHRRAYGSLPIIMSQRTNRRITFEWAAIAGENDTEEEARRLGHLLAGLLCHVNIIPLNPTGGYAGAPASTANLDRFIAVLRQYGVSATVRVRRGIDIDAGCGQLKTAVLSRDQIA